jgi:hypothetical protein
MESSKLINGFSYSVYFFLSFFLNYGALLMPRRLHFSITFMMLLPVQIFYVHIQSPLPVLP